jgi:hypothetical protein
MLIKILKDRFQLKIKLILTVILNVPEWLAKYPSLPPSFTWRNGLMLSLFLSHQT